MQNIEEFLKVVKPYRWSIEDIQTMIKSTYIKYSISLNQKDNMMRLLRQQHARQDNSADETVRDRRVYFVGSAEVGFKYLVDKDYNIIQSVKDFENYYFIYRNNFIAEIFKNSIGRYVISRVFNTSGKELLDLASLAWCGVDDYSAEIKQIKDSHNQTYLIVSLGDIDREYSNINIKTIVYRYDENKQSLSKTYQLGTNTTSVAKVVKFIGDSRVENKEVILSTYQANAVSIHQIVDNDDIIKSLLRKVEYSMNDDWIDISYSDWDNSCDSKLRKASIDNLAVTVIKLFDIDTYMEYTYIDLDEAFMECIQVVEYDGSGNKVSVTDRNRENVRDFRKMGLYDGVIGILNENAIDNNVRSINNDYLYRIQQHDVKHGINRSNVKDTNIDKVYSVNIFADDGKQQSLIESMNMEMPEAFK